MVTTEIKYNTSNIFSLDVQHIIQEHLRHIVDVGVVLVLEKIYATAPRGVTDAYITGLKFVPAKVTVNEIEGKIIMQGRAKEYWDVIERGRTPGTRQPPSGSLVEWMMVKFGLSEKDAKRKEFGLLKKIKEDGIVGRLVVEEAANAIRPYINELIGNLGV